MKKKLIIFGNTKMAEMAYYYFKFDSDYEIESFTVQEEFIKDPSFMGLPVVPFENVESKYDPAQYELFVAVGYKALSQIRQSFCEQAEAKGYQLATYVSSKVSGPALETLKYGKNCFILENQVFQPNVTIGDNVTIWSGNHFGHDVEIDSNSYIASHIVFSGNTRLGSNSFVGVNSCVRDHISIGKKCIIGAGAIITRNVDDETVLIESHTAKYPLTSEQFEKMMGV